MTYGKRLAALLIVPLVAAPLVSATPAPAANAVQKALRLGLACAKELKTYCHAVTAGEGRKIACLYAHNDRLSWACEKEVYEAVSDLVTSMAAVRDAANACAPDIDRYCSQAIPGQGRIALCLEAHRPTLTPGCAARLSALTK